MLLHPNQYSINNPQSPGGPQAPRKTRRTGHKFGDQEELATENKRKRKLFEENEESPGPSGRNMDLGVGSPFREAKARTVHNQFEASAYSLERLFTEKELTMALNQATTAAANFFTKMKNADVTDSATNGTNGTQDHASENGEGPDADQDSDSPQGAPEMTRQISSNPHATRGSTTRSAFNPLQIANGRLPFIYNPPFILDAKIFQKPNAQAPPPPSLAPQDVDQDLALMMRDAPPDDSLCEKLLQAAVNPMKAREYQIQAPDYQTPVPEITSHVRSIAPHLEVLGGVPMSAQSSMAGHSDTGANTPVGRFGDRELATGGVNMARTASGSGRGRGRGRGQ